MGGVEGLTFDRQLIPLRADFNTIDNPFAWSSAPEREAMTEDYLSLSVRGDARPRGDRFVGRVEAERDALVLY